MSQVLLRVWITPAMFLLPAPGFAQAAVYRATQFQCSRFHQRMHSRVRTQGGRRESRSVTEIDASMVFHASQGEDAMALESWFDSLSVWKEAEGERLAPDTDGLIGGRYRGRLLPDGSYTAQDRPFIPEDIAEVVDLREAPGGFLAPLPREPLRPGRESADSGGWRITRLADSTVKGRPLARYRLHARRERSEVQPLSDSVTIELRITEEEDGVLVWDPDRGLLLWDRTSTSRSRIPPAGPVGQPINSRIDQHIQVERSPGPDGCESSPVPADSVR